VALLENVRFHPGEEANDPDFARALAELGELYVTMLSALRTRAMRQRRHHECVQKSAMGSIYVERAKAAPR